MNKIYLTGTVADPPCAYAAGDVPKHTVFPLCVTHRTKQGVIKREHYTIRAWNGVAEWARAHLKQGQRVMVQGYLTQRHAAQADGTAQIAVEVTAEEFFAAPLPRTVCLWEDAPLYRPMEGHGPNRQQTKG